MKMSSNQGNMIWQRTATLKLLSHLVTVPGMMTSTQCAY